MASKITDDDIPEVRTIAQEPNWVTGDLKGYPGACKVDVDDPNQPLQQGDLIKPLLMDIAECGLPYAYAKYTEPNPDDFKGLITTKPKRVIIVGAGIAGLAAAFELQRAGHEVEILEMTARVGGRIKTLGEKEGFAKGLYVEAGAMRLPGKYDATSQNHFLTDFYAKKFELPLVPFHNSDENAFLKLYDEPKVTYSEWNENVEYYMNKLWKNWNATLLDNGRTDIKDIGAYYGATTVVVTDLLRKRLRNAETRVEQATAWHEWIMNWHQFAVDGFLRSTYESVKARVSVEDEADLDPLKELLPWPEAAISAQSVLSYSPALDRSLVEVLRGALTSSPDYHHIEGGFSQLPDAFIKESADDSGRRSSLLPNITFNVTVREVEFTSGSSAGPELHKKVVVRGDYTTSGREFSIEGNAVFVTVPLNILRQIRFVPVEGTPPIPLRIQQSIEDVWYGPATKVMIQSKKRFWENSGIRGGFTRTNLPVGQILYPTNSTGESLADERGILVCYTWKSEALLFGSLPPQSAVEEAVRQIAQIHPEITENYEVGAVQSWYTDPSSQGAYALLKPREYNNILNLMVHPWRNVYFAGEAISFTNGWIQGALASSLRVAYEFYARNEKFETS